MELLARELRHLRAREGLLFIKTFHRQSEIQQSGKLRAGAKASVYLGVVVWFETWQSAARRYEPMQFECDTFADWKANLRGVALAMEKLRAVERCRWLNPHRRMAI
jgi:hypothetical protein